MFCRNCNTLIIWITAKGDQRSSEIQPVVQFNRIIASKSQKGKYPSFKYITICILQVSQEKWHKRKVPISFSPENFNLMLDIITLLRLSTGNPVSSLHESGMLKWFRRENNLQKTDEIKKHLIKSSRKESHLSSIWSPID